MARAKFRSVEHHSIIKMGYSPFLDRAKLVGAAAVSRMADDFRIIVANAGAVTEDDLGVLGWTDPQIAAHGKAARTLAYAKTAAA